MRKYTASLFFLIIPVFLFLSLIFPQKSFAQTRLYQCNPAVDYATAIANCNNGPVDCVDPETGKPKQEKTGKICADQAAIYYSGQEQKTLTAQCIDKCTDIPLTKICSPDVNNNCPVKNFTCQGSVGTPVSGAGDKTFCIQYTEVAPTPTPTPVPCQVTTSPSVHNLVVGGTGAVTASVTSGLGSATISQMRFGSYNTSIATVNPTSDSSSIYSTTVTALAAGNTAVWGTADLSDGRTCQSSGTTDTNVNISTPPTPTPTPTPTCSSFGDCASCTRQPNCGWGGVVIYSCRNGSSNTCPTDYTLWNWTSCGASSPQNTCPVPTPTPTRAPTPTPILVSCPAPRDGSIVVKDGSQWRCIGSCRGIPHGRLTCDFGDVCCEFPLVTLTPTPTAGPTPTPPLPTPPGCGACGTCVAPGAPHLSWLRGCPAGSGSCTSSGCTPPPTPGPTSTPAPTPTPTPIPPCGIGFREKTVTLPGPTIPPPTPIPSPGCKTTGPVGRVGASCSGITCCSGLACIPGDIYNSPKCPNPPPPPSQTSSLAVTKTSYGERNCPGQPLPANAYTAVSQSNNIPMPVDHNRTKTAARCMQWKDTTREAIFNFAQFNIPQGVQITSATLLSPSSAGCQAAFLSGKAGIVSAGSFSSSGFSSAGRFGSNALIQSSSFFDGCIVPGRQFFCGRCSDRVYDCGSSGLASGTGIVTDFIQNAVNTQNLTQVAFLVTPDDNNDLLCFSPESVVSGETGKFSVNNPGPAKLSIKYCEPAPPTPTPTPVPTYSISGAIFTDANGDLKKNPSESNYTGAINISVTNGFANFAVSNSSGNYASNNLPQGQYAVTFSGLPQGSVFTYPSTPLIVNVGSSCSFPRTSEGRCSSGSIFSLNAGVTTNTSAWFQSIGSDMRWDSGFSNILPSNKFASILGTGGMPGIIFSGTITPSFGAGSASQFNWKVSGTSIDTRDVFTDTHNLIPTSYRFLLETVDGSGIAKKTASDLCNGGSAANCTLTANLSNGVYAINGDLTLNGLGYTFPSNKDFVILVNGNLNINEEIHIPIGSTAIFSASGNITVNRGIGETASSAVPTIEGLYSADGNFVADGNKNCSLATDLRLNVAGSVVANAGRGGGTFVNNRDMCARNSSNPSVSFIERPDFMLNYPNLVQQTTRAWQDVAP